MTGIENKTAEPEHCEQLNMTVKRRLEEPVNCQEKTILKKACLESRDQPKVIVEHQPLPSIYELGQVARNLDAGNFLQGEDTMDEESEDIMCNNKNLPQAWSLTPPPSPSYEFLDQSNQRIECDENGKCYLQLGASVQCSQVCPQTCSHSVCFNLPKSSPCYKRQADRMLGLSLNKLQRVDTSLWRSVLICNMLRKIETENDTMTSEPAPPLKDFHSAFRAKPSLPADNSACPMAAAAAVEPAADTEHRTDRLAANSGWLGCTNETTGINWSSVLSVLSPELELTNNNGFSPDSNDGLSSPAMNNSWPTTTPTTPLSSAWTSSSMPSLTPDSMICQSG